MFKGVKNKLDEEEYERVLADEELRQKFYEKLCGFHRTLGVALSSSRFLRETPEKKIKRYKDDLAFFMKLRAAVKKRYAEEIDYKEYEAKVQKLVDTHVTANEVCKITELVNIFEREAFKARWRSWRRRRRRRTPSRTGRSGRSPRRWMRTRCFTGGSRKF